ITSLPFIHVTCHLPKTKLFPYTTLFRSVGAGTHGRENAPPAFDLCSADKGQPPVCKGDYRQPGKPDEVAGRFSRLYGREISRLGDRKSTRLNSSHVSSSYAVFCLKKIMY